jgi:DNA polymerase-3 subunit beta
MHFIIERDALLKPLQMVSGAIERRHTLPILSNVLLDVTQDQIALTGTDLEIELVAAAFPQQVITPGRVTIPAKKLLDICRSLPESCVLTLQLQGDNCVVSTGKSKFTLATLSASDYPNLESWQGEVEFELSRIQLRKLMEDTAFSMANQDVRYYLNGLLFEVDNGTLRTVATDGHRLALSSMELGVTAGQQKQVIIPRKGVLELMRLLAADDQLIRLSIGQNHIRQLTAHRSVLKDACVRASILSNEKYRGVRFTLNPQELQIVANNPEHEQAEEVIEVEYNGDTLEIGFNVGYVLDVLNTLNTDLVVMHLSDANSSSLVEGVGNPGALYVVMPMRL